MKFVECEETKGACKYRRLEVIARGLRAIQFGPRLGKPSSAKSAQPLAKSFLQNELFRSIDDCAIRNKLIRRVVNTEEKKLRDRLL